MKGLNQYSESGRLQKAIIGRYKGYKKEEEYVEHINCRQKSGLPGQKQLQKEFEAFKKTLVRKNVKVLEPRYVGKFVYDQLTPRDVGVVIGDKFVLCNMAKSSRRYEAAGIFEHILNMEGEEPTILIPPEPEMLLEGGDIIIDKETIFVGLTNRTNRAGLNYLKETFKPRFNVVPVPCYRTGDQKVLHLDCVFNPVGKNRALIYPGGIKKVPSIIDENYTLIEVTKKEQKALATNVLSVAPDLVISRDHPHCARVNKRIRQTGIEVKALPFNGAPATGGSFRCCTLPLVRN